MLDLAGGCILGALLGVRHAFEPDHLAAVSTLVSTEPDSWKAALIGVFWGIGHAVSLLAIWVALWVLQVELPVRLMNLFELAVAFMLIGLGARAFRQAISPVRLAAHRHRHRQGGLSRFTLGRPLGAGLLHGAAGSGALVALVMAGLPTPAQRLAYILLFGGGAMVGMAILTGLFSLPLVRLRSSQLFTRILSAGSGVLATVVGIRWAYPPLLFLLG